ncbi:MULTISPECIES: DUF6191 domain-containing protein [Streptomyces]|uniref:Uncharacterized protein n=1 Tax=Streptomyces tsukubensis (strain DSM 42081 / NBRC 108919 / NRRL 18488 / 9993) TaxID=1114943 RepID=I2N347_STRT9|nr:MULTISPECIES: DUF6191 domain-containing protein [Streptomyces]AZK95516.1 hypothetical protein B7R87_17840 [Streptomyces tsukubensis]EIF91444.1 hypothetical protein [Streptomyces tsukubensis NRRL18488]MYS66693.1 hypothetical protein [Streptomyces sp. SID5473]QKM68442.1 hypothetical protein STSU_015960 [Streptomyces tsukubensis NRRL18488]TAI43259.1 hypothetical protein EWI31_15725 [Streptomyces tsukubensis]
MQFIIFMTLPGLVILLTVIAFVDYLMRATGRGKRTGRVSATGFEQLHAAFSPGKATELKERQSSLLMKDDDEDGAPPNRSVVDLDGGVAVVRLPPAGAGGSAR